MIQSLHILNIIALYMWLIHFTVELMILHELIEVELMGTKVVREEFKVGHAFEFWLVGDLLADEVGEMVDDTWVGELASG